MSRLERSWAKEAPRDQVESAFTPILRRLLYRTTGVMAVAFVDEEGECVDYCSALAPYDIKVVAAHLRVLIEDVGRGMSKAGGGESFFLHVHADERDLVARRISREYLLVLVLKPRALTRRLLGGIEHAVSELRAEAAISVEVWEPFTDTVMVEVRGAVGWAYAPAAFLERGVRTEIQDVLGRWMEGAGQHARLCFRVRTVDGEELTLVHDRSLDRWERQRERGDEA
ncbi:hypothetical protein ARNL5_03433 [Anaerolineae bacterium]|nr:hypothetical protein [Sandaracinaceae bacterium]MCC6877429.1 hypothetical protein [Sandaracinaceae bacterium]CAG0993493.1 hypothetical protein ARNL5_03433 [Anaerolineae bacterium]